MRTILMSFFTALLVMSNPAHAFSYFDRFLVLIENQTPYVATITPDGDDNWLCGDFCITQTLKPREVKLFNTGPKDLLPPNGIQGVSINYGHVKSHVEFWCDHAYSVNINVVETSADSLTAGVGTNSPLIKTKIYSLGIKYDQYKSYPPVAFVVLTLATKR